VTNAFIFIQHEWVFVCVIPVSLSVSYPVLLFIIICRGPDIVTFMQKIAYCCRDWTNSVQIAPFLSDPDEVQNVVVVVVSSANLRVSFWPHEGF